MIKPAAQKVWDYFYNERSDVNKSTMAPKHDWYAKDYAVDIDHEHLNDPKVLKLLNTIYSVVKPFEETKELLDKGKELVEKYKIKPTDLVKKAEKSFEQIYYEK